MSHGEKGITRLAQFWWGLRVKGQGEVAEEDRQAAQRCRGHGVFCGRYWTVLRLSDY